VLREAVLGRFGARRGAVIFKTLELARQGRACPEGRMRSGIARGVSCSGSKRIDDGDYGTGHGAGAFGCPAQAAFDRLNRLVLRLLSVGLIGQDDRYWVGGPMDPTHVLLPQAFGRSCSEHSPS
jgi:hypothetical protein